VVEQQLGTGRGEGHVDGVEREVQLLGDQHRDRGEALAHFHARQRHPDPALLGDLDGEEQALRRAAREDEDVAEVLDVRGLRQAGGRYGGGGAGGERVHASLVATVSVEPATR
jgi:hypothetical protein